MFWFHPLYIRAHKEIPSGVLERGAVGFFRTGLFSFSVVQ